MTNMCGVLVAPYARPTAPLSSARTGWVRPKRPIASRISAGSCPCLPGADESIPSHTMPSAAWRAAVVFSDPTVCAVLTKGHLGLNHSRTTVLPRRSARWTAWPSRSLRVKSGALVPISAGVGTRSGSTEAAGAWGGAAFASSTWPREQPAMTTSAGTASHPNRANRADEHVTEHRDLFMRLLIAPVGGPGARPQGGSLGANSARVQWRAQPVDRRPDREEDGSQGGRSFGKLGGSLSRSAARAGRRSHVRARHRQAHRDPRQARRKRRRRRPRARRYPTRDGPVLGGGPYRLHGLPRRPAAAPRGGRRLVARYARAQPSHRAQCDARRHGKRHVHPAGRARRALRRQGRAPPFHRPRRAAPLARRFAGRGRACRAAPVSFSECRFLTRPGSLAHHSE